MLRTLAGWCVRHRRLVVLIWFVVLVGASLLGKSVGSAYSNSFQLPHTQSTDAIALLQSAAPKNAGDTENIVVATSGGAKLTDPAIAVHVDDLIKKVETLPMWSTSLHIRRPWAPSTSTRTRRSALSRWR